MYERKDAFYKRAKKEGYPSRAVYKLKEISGKYGIIKTGDRVIDLGCSPGGWSKIALEIVGPGGKVVGIDISEVKGLHRQNFLFIRGNISDPSVVRAAMQGAGGLCDVVLSDLSPHLTGIKPRDEAAADDLFSAAWSFARQTLCPCGKFLMKLFPGPEADTLVRKIRSHFKESVLTRPKATRKGSSEMYLVGIGFSPAEKNTASAPACPQGGQ